VLLINKFPLLDDWKEPFAIGSISTDITQRKRDEEALLQSTRDLRTAQRVAHVGSWHWDTRTGDVQWSEELYRIFGLDPRQPRPPTQQPSSELLTPESFIRASEAVEKTRATGEPYEAELEIVRPDGAHRWISARGEAICDANGAVIGLDGTAADITDVKELQRLRDEWTSVIAHDLRQPIGTILMASDFLPRLHAGEVNEKEQAFVQRIHSAAQSLRRMVDDLLDMSLLEAHRLKLEQTPTDPREIVAGTIEQLAHLSGIERVKVSANADVSPVYIDRMRIGQVLANLVSNAIKYGDEHTDITIGIEQRGGEVDFAVTNHGPGIAPDELPRLFNRFMRSRSTRGSGVPGLGLGLYISRGIVEAHGGRLWAESTPGVTTTFHLVLPVSIAIRHAA
jgi:PAS domain S-box-containing protein